MGDEARQFVHFDIEQILHLAMRKFVEVKKSESAPLRLGRRGDPGRELHRFQLRNSRCRLGRDNFLGKRRGFSLHIVFRDEKALMTRLVKTPKPIAHQLPARGEERRFLECVLECRQRPFRMTRHEKTEAIQLRQTAGEQVRFFFLQSAKTWRPRTSRARPPAAMR